MNSQRPDLSKHPWPISPTFRAGPRHAGYDQNAEEIIRFVRHFQRPDIQQLGAPSVKRKPVLPAIGGYYRCAEVNNLADDVHCPVGSFRSELSRSWGENHIGRAAVEITCSNDKHLKRGLDATESCNQGDCKSLENWHNNNNEVLLEALALQEAIETENRYVSNFQESLDDIADIKSMIRDEPLFASRSTKPCSSLNKFKAAISTTSAAIIDHSKPLALTYYSKTPDIRQLQALPQLPPIGACNLPSRPSAPSPSPMSPTPMSGSDINCSSDEDREDYEI